MLVKVTSKNQITIPKINENFPTILISDLSEQGHEILSVYQQGVEGYRRFNFMGKSTS